LFAILPGGYNPLVFQQISGLFEQSLQSKHSLVRECLQCPGYSTKFIRGNVSLLSLDLARVETFSIQELILLNSFLKK